MDLTCAIVLSFAALPLLALLALIVRSDGCPWLFTQVRIGAGGRPFRLYKVRTMRPGSGSGAQWAELDDPRITRIGKLLRRTHIDELPQLFNVIRGEMSLVGPRPLPQRDYERLEEWHRKRYLVLPGMTGLWQISGRSNLSFDDLVRYDFYYLDNWSIWLDISILAKTIPAVLAQRGAY